ncbi:AMP-binding protein [Corynebacterium glyciniphilum]|uniref:AMP-binding protein n=1 Tax=Corynebacterium glyciniphilum TaxID=1404244 RepID=UPI002650B320|nr:AMP-binding protein [Corynebacterium glyciniphilum]MDN6704604.1 AMP-binding protein [Corynebacterium glyciniphilum]
MEDAGIVEELGVLDGLYHSDFSVEFRDGVSCETYGADQFAGLVDQCDDFIFRRRLVGKVIVLAARPSPQQIAMIIALIRRGIVFALTNPSSQENAVASILSDERYEGTGLVVVSLDERGFDCAAMAIGQEKRGEGDVLCLATTSGTTGTPKVVEFTKSALKLSLNGVLSVTGRPVWSSRVLLAQSVEFDGFFEELFCVLECGGTAIIPLHAVGSRPDFLLSCLDEWRITCIDLPTAVFNTFGTYLAGRQANGFASRMCGGVTFVIGGQRFLPPAVEAIGKVFPNASVVNTYGPTEATITCAAAVIWAHGAWRASGQLIGWTYPGVNSKLIYDGRQMSESGVLVLGGCAVEGAPAASLSVEDGAAWLDTGDLVSVSERGYVFERRKGGFIKVGGRRVDLAAVRAELEDVTGTMVRPEPAVSARGLDHLRILVVRSPDCADSHLVRALRRSPSLLGVPTEIDLVDRLGLSEVGKG